MMYLFALCLFIDSLGQGEGKGEVARWNFQLTTRICHIRDKLIPEKIAD